MHEINITVRNKVATRDGTDYVCGNSDYVVNFDFDEEWDAYETKTARFAYNGKSIDVIFDGAQCAVPVITNAYFFLVGVFAGNLHTTTPVRVPCVKSILCGGGTPADPPEDVYAQIMEEINSLSISGLSTVQIAALDALFKIAVYKEDASAAYSAFRAAFGLDEVPDEGGDSGDEEPGGGDSGGSGESGSTVYRLTSGDFVNAGISILAPYVETNPARFVHVDSDLKVSPGETVTFEITGTTELRIAGWFINEIGAAIVDAGESLKNTGGYVDTTWLESGATYTVPKDAKYVWVNIKRADNATMTAADITQVTLTRGQSE